MSFIGRPKTIQATGESAIDLQANGLCPISRHRVGNRVLYKIHRTARGDIYDVDQTSNSSKVAPERLDVVIEFFGTRSDLATATDDIETNVVGRPCTFTVENVAQITQTTTIACRCIAAPLISSDTMPDADYSSSTKKFRYVFGLTLMPTGTWS